MKTKVAVVFAVLFFASLAQAGTVYTYTGDAYTLCEGNYTCTGTAPALSITFDTTLKGEQLDNLTIGTVPGGDLTAYVSAFTFTDGTGLVITEPDAITFDFDFTTSGNGTVLGWQVSVVTPLLGANTAYDSPLVPSQDDSVTYGEVFLGAGFNYDDPGVWTVPEPSGFALMLVGIGLVAVMRKRIMLRL